MSLYGYALWSLNCNEIKHLDVWLNKCLQRIWSLLPNSHTGTVHYVSGCVSVYSIMCVSNASISCTSLPVVAIILYFQFFVLLLFPVAILLVRIIVLFPWIQLIRLES